MRQPISARRKAFWKIMGAMSLGSIAILAWFQFFVAAPVNGLRNRIEGLNDSDPDAALALYPQLVDLIEKQNMWSADKAKALFQWGEQLLRHKRYEQAILVLQKCLNLCRDHAPGTSEAQTRLSMAICKTELGPKRKLTDGDFNELYVAAKVHPPIESAIDMP